MKHRALRIALHDPTLRVKRLDYQTATASVVLVLTGLFGLAVIISKIAAV